MMRSINMFLFTMLVLGTGCAKSKPAAVAFSASLRLGESLKLADLRGGQTISFQVALASLTDYKLQSLTAHLEPRSCLQFEPVDQTFSDIAARQADLLLPEAPLTATIDPACNKGDALTLSVTWQAPGEKGPITGESLINVPLTRSSVSPWHITQYIINNDPTRKSLLPHEHMTLSLKIRYIGKEAITTAPALTFGPQIGDTWQLSELTTQALSSDPLKPSDVALDKFPELVWAVQDLSFDAPAEGRMHWRLQWLDPNGLDEHEDLDIPVEPGLSIGSLALNADPTDNHSGAAAALALTLINDSNNLLGHGIIWLEDAPDHAYTVEDQFRQATFGELLSYGQTIIAPGPLRATLDATVCATTCTLHLGWKTSRGYSGTFAYPVTLPGEKAP